MQKLNHVLAVEKQVKTNSGEQQTKLYHEIQQSAMLNGITRKYVPKDDDGERFPDENQAVHVRVKQKLEELVKIMSPLYDTVATKDNANRNATADVVVNGVTVLRNITAVTLLYLEKELVHIHTFVSKLPELPLTETWTFDPNSDCFKSEPVQSGKTKKIHKPFVKYEATKEHPAQVDVVSEDIITGYWTTTKFSGAIRREDKRKLVERVEALLAAVKVARETANQADAPKVSVAKEVFDFIMAS
jgi:hypothetical protein